MAIPRASSFATTSLNNSSGSAPRWMARSSSRKQCG
jgi:hypothetical protein